MIVDDEPSVLEQVRSYLEHDEFDVVTVTNSRQALDVLDDKEDTVDLILIDTPIPGSSEKGLFSVKPKSTTQTAKTDTFLQKPFTREQLINFVRDGME